MGLFGNRFSGDETSPKRALTNEELRHIDEMILNNYDDDSKMNAIKYYFDETGCSLIEAKEHVESVLMQKKYGISADTDTDDLDRIIREKYGRENMMHAIKFYKDATGCGLKEAKEHVEMVLGI